MKPSVSVHSPLLAQAGQIAKHTITAALIVALTGCASIIDGGPKNVSVKSDPSGARVRVYDKKGVEVASQETPAILSLKRGGAYSTARYRVVIEKPGYQPAEVTVKSTLNGWYFGNLIFGGLLGLLIIDPLTGAMWTLTPKDTSVVLQQQTAGFRPEDGGFFVMLRQDVPEQFAGRLVQLPPQ